MYWTRTGFGWMALVMACGPVVAGGPDESSSTAMDATSPTTAPEVTSEDPDPSTSTTTATSVGDTGTGTTAEPDPSMGTFLPAPDAVGQDACDLWKQDCPRGEKCMPWANDGGFVWNATRCSPLDPNPAGVGEECTVEGSAYTGIDNCGISAMCWDVDPDTNVGECVAFCAGSKAVPVCADQCTSCYIGDDSVLTLCLPSCDPLAQDCDEGEGCYATNDTFACSPDVSTDEGAIGQPCEFINACDPGSACVQPDFVPGCENPSGCCAPFCSLEVADPCEELLPGTVCAPWWEDGQAPPGGCVDHAAIGVCLAP